MWHRITDTQRSMGRMDRSWGKTHWVLSTKPPPPSFPSSQEVGCLSPPPGGAGELSQSPPGAQEFAPGVYRFRGSYSPLPPPRVCTGVTLSGLETSGCSPRDAFTSSKALGATALWPGSRSQAPATVERILLWGVENARKQPAVNPPLQFKKRLSGKKIRVGGKK